MRGLIRQPNRHRRFELLVWLVVQACCLTLVHSAPTRELGSYVRRWTTQHGLPQNNIRALAQTPDGYLWVGTYFGLCRFDGVRFEVFDSSNTPEMLGDAVNAMELDREDGSLWIATNRGVLRIADGEFRRFGSEHRIGSVWVMAMAYGGGVWAATRDGEIVRITKGQVQTHAFGESRAENHVRWLCERSAGDLVVGLATHQGRLVARTGSRLELEKFSSPTGETVACLSPRSGRLWYASQSEIGQLTPQGPRPTLLPSSFKLGRVDWLRAEPGGRVWGRVRDESLFWIDEDTSQLGSLGDLPKDVSSTATCVLRDREGSLWVGSESGLICARKHRVQMITKADGLPDDQAWKIVESPRGQIWIGTQTGVARWDGNRAELFWNLQGPTRRFERRENNLWLPGEPRALWTDAAVPGIRWPWLDETGILEPAYQDRDGGLWTWHQRRLVLTGKSGRIQFDSEHGLPNADIRAVHQDRAGNMWFGTYGQGLLKLEGDRLRKLTTTNSELNNRVWSIHEDDQGDLWMGTQAGLNRLHGGVIQTFTAAHGLHENVVNHVLEDELGYLWWGGLKGIYRAPRTDFLAVAEGRSSRVRCLALGEADGMLSPETNGEHTPAACRTGDGRLWFPTVRGVAIVTPQDIERSERDSPVPPVVVESISADGRLLRQPDLRSPERLTFPPGTAGVVEVRYTANCFAAPEWVRFRYQLARNDEAPVWTDAGARRVAFFTNLKPGSYRFHVSAADHSGRWNLTGASVNFRLLPHFWQTWFFPFLCATLFLSLAAGVTAYRLRWQHHLLSARHDRKLADERARIARDLHDDLGTALTGVGLELDVTRREAPPELNLRLGQSASRVRALAERMREVVWAVNPSCDSVISLVSFLEQQAQSMLAHSSIRCRFHFPENIPDLALQSEQRHQIALCVREILNNAIRHAHCQTVEMSLVIDANRLVVRVADDGRGFDPSSTPSATGGRGIPNIQTRLKQLGGTALISSTPGKGTVIELSIPIATPS